MEQATLTGRQKLVYEAFQKIQQGEQMMKEGRIELNNLIPEAKDQKIVANRTLRRGPGLFRKVNQTDAQLIDRILGMIDKEPRVTANHVHKKLRLSERHVRRLKDKMKKDKLIVEKGSPGGGAIIWTKASVKAVPDNYIRAEDHADRVLTYLKNTSWVTTHKLADDLKLTWYPAKRVLEYLTTKGSVKVVKRSQNPLHKGTRAFNREIDYWEAAV